jgi:prepilin-type N-terminal cleavage/methylation domain-containing protein
VTIKAKTVTGFTLLELVVVTAVIAILVGLLLPALRSAKDRAKRTTCINSLRQINLGARMYSDDSNDTPPSSGATNTAALFSGYKELMKSYVGVKEASSSRDRLFACPADKFFPSFAITNAVAPWQWVRESLHDQAFFNYSSYAFNGGDNKTRVSEAGPWTPPGLTGRKLSSIRNPARTVLVMDASALVPWSWHDAVFTRGEALPYKDAKNVVSFVDGHVTYIKIYWHSVRLTGGGMSFAFASDPPAEYDYQWSGD